MHALGCWWTWHVVDEGLNQNQGRILDDLWSCQLSGTQSEFDADLVSRFLAKLDGHREVLRQVYRSAMTGRPNHPRSRQDGAQ